MSSYYFIKLYHETLEDPRMGKLPDRLWRRAVELSVIANQEEARDGTLPPVIDMSWKLRTDEEELSQELEELEKAGIIERKGESWFVVNFAQQQSPVSDQERKQRQRERDKKERYIGHEPVTKRDIELDIEPELELEIELESSPPTAEIAAPPAPKKPPPKKSLLEPDTWQARMMFAKLAANARAKGRRVPKRFGSLEQKQKFIEAAARLDGQFDDALDAGLGLGILAVGRLVNYIASPKWQEKQQPQQQKRQQQQKIEETLDVKLQREEVRRRLGRGDG